MQVLKKKRLKNIYLQVRLDSIEVRAPLFLKESDIYSAVKRELPFISKSYQKLLQSKALESSNELLFLGKPLLLDVSIQKDVQESFCLRKESLQVTLNSALTQKKKEQLRELLYKENAAKILEPEVLYWQEKMGVCTSKINYRKTKSQWGSCSYKNALSLNTYLLALPKQLRDYIIIHELSHIVYKNHSKLFWALVEQFFAEHKSARAKLKKYAILLR